MFCLGDHFYDVFQGIQERPLCSLHTKAINDKKTVFSNMLSHSLSKFHNANVKRGIFHHFKNQREVCLYQETRFDEKTENNF